MKDRKVRWGILSTAKIGMIQVLPAMRTCASLKLWGVASRNEEAAKIAAGMFDMPKWYGSYEALLADIDVEAVYIPLPNHLHVPWAIKSVEAGKHVLCEKPMAMSEAEACQLLAVAEAHPNIKVMEAFMYRFHPQWVKTVELISSGAIGDPVSIQSFFSYFNDDPENIRNIKGFGGGALMDIGCYCISLSRWIFGGEPDEVLGHVRHDPKFGTDCHFHGIMNFGTKTSTFTCSTQLEGHQRVVILGREGSIEIMIPFNPPIDRPSVLQVRRGKRLETITFEPCSHYAIQAEHFSRAILDHADVPTPLSDGVANLHVLETLLRSAETRSWTNC